MTTWHRVCIGKPISVTPCSGVLNEITHSHPTPPNRQLKARFHDIETSLARGFSRGYLGCAPGEPSNQRTPPIFMIDGVRGGRCRIRTYVGISRRIYSPLPLAARAICRVRRFRCAEQLTTYPPGLSKRLHRPPASTGWPPMRVQLSRWPVEPRPEFAGPSQDRSAVWLIRHSTS